MLIDSDIGCRYGKRRSFHGCLFVRETGKRTEVFGFVNRADVGAWIHIKLLTEQCGISSGAREPAVVILGSLLLGSERMGGGGGWGGCLHLRRSVFSRLSFQPRGEERIGERAFKSRKRVWLLT